MGTRTYRVLAGVALAGLGGLGLTGCEVSKTFAAQCVANPPAPHQDIGVISMTVDVPPEVEAGDTFTVVVRHVGVAAGPVESPPPAELATISVSGAATPSGGIGLSSNFEPVAWPAEVELTATGAPGDTIAIGVASGTDVHVDGANIWGLTCSPSGSGHVATIRLVEPS